MPPPPRSTGKLGTNIRRYAHLLREGICRAASFEVENSFDRYIASAADLDGTFAMARMRPCFQGLVKIATVGAARARGGSDAGGLASTAAWAGLVRAPWLARVLQLRYPGGRPACGQRGGGEGVWGRGAGPGWLGDLWRLAW